MYGRANTLGFQATWLNHPHFEFCSPTKIVFGNGILENAAEVVQSFGPSQAILITDKVLTNLGAVEKIKANFKHAPVQIRCIYDNVPPNSTLETVESCAQLAQNHACDLVIGFGGGSVMDTAKVANLLIVKGGKAEDHIGAYLLGNRPLLPSILIPTTAGTGAEVTKVAVIADLEKHIQLPFEEHQFLPQMAILDPTVTVSMPPRLTAVTGMDALTHAIEAYLSKEHNPITDSMALSAIQLIHDHLLTACAHSENLDARGAMLIASCMAGIAISHARVGMVHGISQALGAVYHIPHGLGSALVLPEVIDYNLGVAVDRYADIAEAFGAHFPSPVSEVNSLWQSYTIQKPLRVFSKGPQPGRRPLKKIDDWFKKQQAKSAIEQIRLLNRHLAYVTEMPLNLKEAGIKDDLAQLDQVVDIAMQSEAMPLNPKPMEREAVMKIVKKLYRSKIKPLKVSV